MNADSNLPCSSPKIKQTSADWLVGGGEAGELVRSLNWSVTPLGPRDAWPQSLRTVVNLVLASSYPMAVLWGSDLILIYNDSYGIIAGDRHPDAMGRSTRDVWSESWEFRIPLYESVMTRGESPHLEDQLFRVPRHGCIEDAYFTFSYSPIRTDDGAIGGTLLVLSETTQRVVMERRLKQTNEALEVRIATQERAEKELRESEDRFRCLLENTREAIWSANISGQYDFLSPVMADIYGRPLSEMRDNTVFWYEIVHPEDQARARAAHESLLRDQHVELEYRIFRPDGTRVWIFDRRTILRDEDGNPNRIAGILSDITERKQAEERLIYIVKAVESASDAIWISDCQGRHFYQNKASSNLFGYTTAEELQAAGGEAAVVKDPEVAKQIFNNIMHGKPWVGELEMVTKSGRVFTAFERVDAIQDDTGNIIGRIGIVADITEHKVLEAQLHQARRMESVSRLAGGVAHDFNNMLGVIIGHAEMALTQLDPARPPYDDLVEIRKAADRSVNLTRQLLAFARKQIVAPRVLDLNLTIASMLNMLQKLIGENLNLNWRPYENLWSVNVDPGQIDQMLANLCINARDAIAGVGKITIGTGNRILDEDYCAAHPGSVPGEYVLLAVSDEGCGMDKAVLANIFEPFFTTKGIGKGVGLGLATVYGIVKQNNGFIDVCSEPGQGATFTVYLPRYVHKTEPAAETQGVALAAKRGRETILLVDDEPAILKLTERMLERQDYTVLAAPTPGDAIRLAKEQGGKNHLLITDVVMPEMNGPDLAKELLSLYPHIKRLFVSGYTADVIADHGVLDESVHFIQKPFTLQRLTAKIREVLDQA